MASLSVKELSKRNNFNTFVKRIAIGQGFYLVGVDELVLLDPLILSNINDIDGLKYYQNKNSIILPTKNGKMVKLTNLYKDSEFSNRTQNTTIKQDLEIYNLSNQLEEIKKRTNKKYVKVRVNNVVCDVVSIATSPFGYKSDFHFVDIKGADIFHISHKHGNSPKDFQQWSGTSKRFQEKIFNHPEMQDFIKAISLIGNELPKATTMARKIKDDVLKQMAVYGINFGQSFGLNNVSAVYQGKLLFKNIGDCYMLTASHNVINNNSVPSGSYEPVFLAVHKKDRSDHSIKNARITISPIGGRRIKEFI